MYMSNIAIMVIFFIESCHSDFNIWDHCNETTSAARCTLASGQARYAYGSGYESGSTEWYLMGGTTNSGTSFITTDTVTIINLPSDSSNFAQFECATPPTSYPTKLPQPLGQNAGSVINNELYSFGGFNNQYVYLDKIYNSNTTIQSSFGDKLSTMPFGVSSGCTITNGTKTYIIGGLTSGDTLIKSLLMYNAATNGWSELANMSTTRFAPTCTFYDGKIYVFGGQTGDFGPYLNSTEIYDINSNSWSLSSAQLSYKANWMSSAFVNAANKSLILIMGGSAGYPQTVYNNLDVYDIMSDTIISRQKMKKQRYAFNSITLSHQNFKNKFILMAGGKNGNQQTDGEVDAIWCNQ